MKTSTRCSLALAACIALSLGACGKQERAGTANTDRTAGGDVATADSHRVTDVEPGPSKTAWAGWFCTEPSFMDVISGKVKL